MGRKSIGIWWNGFNVRNYYHYSNMCGGYTCRDPYTCINSHSNSDP